MKSIESVFMVMAILASFLCTTNVSAQGKKDGSLFEIILEGGSILPDQIDQLQEIQGFWGLGLGLASGGKSFVLGYANSTGEGTQIHNIGFGMRKDVSISTLTGIVEGGLDITGMKRPGFEGLTYFGGAHIGGGIMALISKGLYLRMNMKFNASPGVIMFLGFGILYRPAEDI